MIKEAVRWGSLSMPDPTLTQGRCYIVYVPVCIAKQLDFEVDLGLLSACLAAYSLSMCYKYITALTNHAHKHLKEISLTGGKPHQAHNRNVKMAQLQQSQTSKQEQSIVYKGWLFCSDLQTLL